MELDKLTKLKGIKNKAKRVGRGIGSGKGGHTSGRGNKGQKAREGNKPALGFEGGQVPLYKRLPHIGGFRNPVSKKFTSVPLSKLNSFADGTEVSPIELLKSGSVKKIARHGVKILAVGELKKKLTLIGFIYSEKARTLVQKSGSKIHE